MRIARGAPPGWTQIEGLDVGTANDLRELGVPSVLVRHVLYAPPWVPRLRAMTEDLLDPMYMGETTTYDERAAFFKRLVTLVLRTKDADHLEAATTVLRLGNIEAANRYVDAAELRAAGADDPEKVRIEVRTDRRGGSGSGPQPRPRRRRAPPDL